MPTYNATITIVVNADNAAKANSIASEIFDDCWFDYRYEAGGYINITEIKLSTPDKETP